MKQVSWKKREQWEDIKDIIENVHLDNDIRIEALMIMEECKIPCEQKPLFTQSLCTLLEWEEKYDVKVFVASTAIGFMEYENVETTVIKHLFEETDVYLRHCYFDGVMRIKEEDKRKAIYQRLLKDSVFQNLAKRYIEKLEEK